MLILNIWDQEKYQMSSTQPTTSGGPPSPAIWSTFRFCLFPHSSSLSLLLSLSFLPRKVEHAADHLRRTLLSPAHLVPCAARLSSSLSSVSPSSQPLAFPFPGPPRLRWRPLATILSDETLAHPSLFRCFSLSHLLPVHLSHSFYFFLSPSNGPLITTIPVGHRSSVPHNLNHINFNLSFRCAPLAMAFTRATVGVAVKYSIVERPGKIDDILYPEISRKQ